MSDPYDALFSRLRTSRFAQPVDPNWVPQQGIPGLDNITPYGFIEDGSVDTAQLQDNAVTAPKITDATITAQKFASGLTVPKLETSLPALPDADYPEGTIVFLTTDGKLYRNLDDEWTKEVESEDIVSITADKITAGTLAAAVLLSGFISTAASGTRVEFDSDGIRAYNGSTLIANIPTDGVSDVYFKAVIQALGLTVVGDATFLGAGNTIEGGAVLTVNEGISDPSTAPVLSAGWPTTTLTSLPGSFGWAAEYNASGGAGGATAVYYFGSGSTIYEVNASTGAYIRTWTPSGLTGLSVAGIAVLGGYIYLFDFSTGGSVIRRYSETTLALDTSYSSVAFPVSGTRIGNLASDGTNLYILQYDTETTLKWQKYDSSMTAVGSVQSITSSELTDPFDMKVGSFDFGAARMVIVQPGQSAHVYDLSNTHKTDECFPVSDGSSLMWDGSNFLTVYTYTGSSPNYTYYLSVHTGWTWAAATSDTVWVAYSWYDSNATGGTHETLVSPKQSITMGRRKRLSVTTPTEPGAGGTDDPDGRRIYVAHSSTEPTSANMDLQATTSDETYYLTSYSSAGAAPPGSNDFSSSGVGEIKSAAGEWSLKGDGYMKFPGGTSFPASPSTGDRYFRTDHMLEFYYDGTRWLSTQLFTAGPSNAETSSGSYYIVLSATQATFMRLALPPAPGSDIYVEKLLFTAYVNSGGSALSASHKWDVEFEKVSVANIGTSLGTATIDSGNSSNWRLWELAVDAVLGGGYSTYPHIRLSATKTGTPGSLNVTGGTSMTYRVVAT